MASETHRNGSLRLCGKRYTVAVLPILFIPLHACLACATGYSKVRLATELLTGQQWACKIMRLPRLDQKTSENPMEGRAAILRVCHELIIVAYGVTPAAACLICRWRYLGCTRERFSSR